MEPALDLPAAWLQALARAGEARCLLVLGPTDVGKSSFIRALAALRPDLVLLDLDPGQKMIGPPGSASLGAVAPEVRLEHFVFLGSTAVGAFGPLLAAGQMLATRSTGRPIAVNTSGYVKGPGMLLQRLTIEALRPDLVAAIGFDAPAGWAPPGTIVRLAPSPLARRKSPGQRRALRQRSFEEAIAGAIELVLDPASATFAPAPPVVLSGGTLPVCALADSEGEDMAIGILHEAGPEGIRITARPPPRPVASIRLGKMWVRHAAGETRLLDSLRPAWEGD